MITPTAIQRFDVELNKRTFYCGERIEGQVRLVTTAPIKCRGIRFQLIGTSSANFKVWVTNIECCIIIPCICFPCPKPELQDFSNNFFYWRESLVLWGASHRTETINEAGRNAVFGSPFSPNEGVLKLRCDDSEAQFALRVMDEDLGKRDDMLGEALFRASELIGCGEVTIPLRRNGKPTQATITLVATLEAGALTLRCIRALALRPADNWFGGKNDVYVQVYPLATADPSKRLPKPSDTEVLPAGDYTWPLSSYTVPEHLPASCEIPPSGAYLGASAVRYSAIAIMEMPWSVKNVYTERTITIAPRLPSTFGPLAQPLQLPSAEKMARYYACCCCMCEIGCIDRGKVALRAAVSRQGGMPGEAIRLAGEARSGLKVHAQLVVSLRRTHRLWAAESTNGYSGRAFDEEDKTEWVLLEHDIPPGGTLDLSQLAPAVIPPVPASYHGGLARSPDWERTMKQYGMGSNAQLWWTKNATDPVIWWYELDVSILVPWGENLSVKTPFVVTACCPLPSVFGQAVSMAVGEPVLGLTAPATLVIDRGAGVQPPVEATALAVTAAPVSTNHDHVRHAARIELPLHAQAPLDLALASAIEWKSVPEQAVSTSGRFVRAVAMCNLTYTPEFPVVLDEARDAAAEGNAKLARAEA